MNNEVDNGIWNLINELSAKQGITEIIINGPKSVFIEKEGVFSQLNVVISKKDVMEFIKEVATFNRKRCDMDHPIMDGNLPDGSRINIMSEPFAKGFPAITIRKYLKFLKSFDGNKNLFNLGDYWVTFLKSLVKSRQNIIVSGGTGVGKTTLINLLLQEVDHTERIVIIEDTIEISLTHQNCVRLETNIFGNVEKPTLTVRDMVKNSLRMRPDRIVVGEVRGGEVFDLLQAMNVGHDGSMASIHSNSASECLQRMESLYLLSGNPSPLNAVRKQISAAVDFIIQLNKTRDGKRIVESISEITGMDGDTISLQDIAVFKDDALARTGMVPSNMKILHQRSGIPLDYMSFNE